jgi:hypothetical protein
MMELDYEFNEHECGFCKSVLEAELETHKTKLKVYEKSILKLAERLFKAVEETESLKLEMQKKNGHLAELLKGGQLDDAIDFIYNDIDQSEEEFIWGLDIGELKDTIAGMWQESYMRMHDQFESYKSMVVAEILEESQESHQAGEKVLLTSTGTVLRLVPAER